MSEQADATVPPTKDSVKDVFLITKMTAGTVHLEDPETGETIWGLGIKFGTNRTPEEDMVMTSCCPGTPVLFISEQGLVQLQAYVNKSLAEIPRERAKAMRRSLK